jgi:hypothetical protein
MSTVCLPSRQRKQLGVDVALSNGAKERACLDGIAKFRAGAVQLYLSEFAWRHAGLRESGFDEATLSLAIGCSQTG